MNAQTQEFKVIKSVADAYQVAAALFESLDEGQSTEWNCVEFTKLPDNYMSVKGWIKDKSLDGSGRWTACELADLALYPERKKFNDYIKSRILHA